MEKNKAVEVLREAKKKIQEATELIGEIEVYEKVGEEYMVNKEYEESLQEVYEIKEAINDITTSRKEAGALDILQDKIKDSLIEFFRENKKQKKYEGDIMQVGFYTRSLKEVTDEADPQFKKIEIKPNTEAINEFMKATKSDDFPDGKLPKGVKLKTYEYINYKPVIND